MYLKAYFGRFFIEIQLMYNVLVTVSRKAALACAMLVREVYIKFLFTSVIIATDTAQIDSSRLSCLYENNAEKRSLCDVNNIILNSSESLQEFYYSNGRE